VTIPEEAGLRNPTLMLALGACLVGFGTMRLVDARTAAPAAEAGNVQPVEVMPTVEAAPGIVAAGHPLLPERFHGVRDEILASPMLHHPPFAAEVERWVDRWSTAFGRWMPTYLERMTAFEGYVSATLTAHDLPPSLRYLPVIESGYSPTAVSSASAVGMWQFMTPTARDLGVEVSSLVDDRRDPFVSTAAAADYLVELHDRYRSWFLALAAYNAGPDRIDGLLHRWLPDVEPSDAVYWALRDVLPSETRDFVPNFIGAVVVASDPEAYGFEAPRPAPFDFESVPVRGSVSFATIARATGRHTDEIARLNPELLRGVTPPDREIELRLPPGSAAAFRDYFSELADRDR
jgi:membrane-bound lytic murein transglycosylase D